MPDRAAELVRGLAPDDNAADIADSVRSTTNHVSSMPIQTARGGQTGCSFMSAAAIDRLMPRMPMRWTLPKVSFTSLSAGTAAEGKRRRRCVPL